MALEPRAEAFYRCRGHVSDLQNGVWVAQGDDANFYFFPVCSKRIAQCLLLCPEGHQRRTELRDRHPDADHAVSFEPGWRRTTPVAQLQRLLTGPRHQPCNTSRTVATLFGPAAIGIEYAVVDVVTATFRSLKPQQLIEADAATTIREATNAFG